MIVTILLSVVFLILVSATVYLSVRYVPVAARLFLRVRVGETNRDYERFEGEDVTFDSEDGVKLAGTLGPAPNGNNDAPLVVFCHQYSACRHAASRYIGFLQDQEFRVFTFSFAGHGDSESHRRIVSRQWPTTNESKDLRAALAYVRSRDDVNTSSIGLFGTSRGAVTALVVASEDPDISCVVGEGTFSSIHVLYQYIHLWGPHIIKPGFLVWLVRPFFIYNLVRWIATRSVERRLNYRFLRVIPTLKKLEIPVLLIHDADDKYISVRQAKMMKKAGGSNCELWIVPGAEHNGAIDVVPGEYERRVTEVFRNHLGTASDADSVEKESTLPFPELIRGQNV